MIYYDDFDNTTIEYRISGFINTCELDLSGSEYKKMFSPIGMTYVNKTLENDNMKYNINFSRCIDEKGKYFIMIGKYNELDLLFANYYDKDRNKNIVHNLPFKVSLGKSFNNYTYLINIETIKHSQVKFDITKKSGEENLFNKLTFYVNTKDFDMILKIIGKYIHNPEIFFNSCIEIMDKKKVVFNNQELNKIDINNENNSELIKKNIKKREY